MPWRPTKVPVGPSGATQAKRTIASVPSCAFPPLGYQARASVFAHKQAMQEFEAGKLHEFKKSIARYQPREQTNSAAPTEGVGKANLAIGPALAATPANLPTRPATAPPQLPIEALPDNVFPLRCYSKFFHSGRDDDSVW